MITTLALAAALVELEGAECHVNVTECMKSAQKLFGT